MTTLPAFLLFTVVPTAVMVAAIGYIVVSIHSTRDKRPLLLVALLTLMCLHQVTEMIAFGTGRAIYSTSPVAETYESGANVLASAASYVVIQQIDELEETREKLRTSNAALTERSSMVSVLNRVLRHNVRNDVNVIANRAEHAASRSNDEEVCADLETVQKTAWRLAAISDRTQRVNQLLTETDGEDTLENLEESLASAMGEVESERAEGCVTVDAPESVPEVRAISTFPAALADVVDRIVAHNDGTVAVDVRITTATEDGDDVVVVRVDDDGNGLPELDVQAVSEGKETPLNHAEGLALWSLEWTVSKAGGNLDVSPPEETLEVRLTTTDGEETDAASTN